MWELVKEIASYVSSLTIIVVALNKLFDKKIEPLCKSVSKLDENHCKDFLISFLEKMEKGEVDDEIEIKRAYEVYDHYTNVLHKNSYIHDKWERIMKGANS